MSFFPSPAKVYAMAEAYGEAGRQMYIKARYSFDIVWPLAYTFFMVSLTTYFLKGAHGDKSRWVKLNLIALAPLVFDLVENSLAIAIMAAYPRRWDAVAVIMASATALKWTTMGVAFVLLSYALGAFLWKRLASRPA